jgi:branched-chain amino acid transport system permease protein
LRFIFAGMTFCRGAGTSPIRGANRLLADYGSWYLILLGVVAIAIMLKAQEGLWGLIAKRFNLHLFSVRRHLTR